MQDWKIVNSSKYSKLLYLRFPPLQIPTCVFRTCIFHPCIFVITYSVLAYSILRYFRFPYLRFQSPHRGCTLTPLHEYDGSICAGVAMRFALSSCCMERVCRYNWHTAGSLGWKFSVLKYKYIFQIKYTETILSAALGNCYG